MIIFLIIAIGHGVLSITSAFLILAVMEKSLGLVLLFATMTIYNLCMMFYNMNKFKEELENNDR